MHTLRVSAIALVVIFCFAGSLHGQSLWSGILDSSRAIDWSLSGATIATARTKCITSQCNAVSSGTTITVSSINAALASAPANTYVSLPAGTFTMTAGLVFNNISNVTLRGSGSNTTFLVFTSGSATCGGGNHDICAEGGDANYWGGPSNTAIWSGTNGTTGTYTKGATSIILSNINNLAVGNPIILDQIDDQTDNGALYVGCEFPDGSGSCYSASSPTGYQRGSGALSTIRGQQQIVNVTSISGAGPYTIGITPGIYASNWRTSQSPGAWWATSPVTGDAVENISLDHTNGGDGITFFNCTGCWVKGVRSVRASTTGTGYYHVGFLICNHCTVRDSYFYGYAGDSYMLPSFIASDLLIENNITQQPAGVIFNSDCEGCVSTYNFSVNPVTGPANWFSQSQYYHGIALFTLQEGNIGGGLYADSFHGTHVLNTQFRNRWDGREQNNGNATTSGTVALRLNPGARYDNAVGNVLGTPGYDIYYTSSPPGTNLYTSVIGLGTYAETGTSDSLVATTRMFWGNYDVVTAAVRWCGNSSNTGWATTCASTSEVPTGLATFANAVPASQVLPSSFIYTVKPSWWPAGKTWPPIGPDVTGGNVGQCSGGTYDSSEAISGSECTGGTLSLVGGGMVTSLPAMDCYLNTMGGGVNGTGSALSFDSSGCYPTSGYNPNPPSYLTAVVN